MFGKCQSRQSTCKEIWYWTMVIYWSRFWVGEWRFVGQGLHHNSFTCTIHHIQHEHIFCLSFKVVTLGTTEAMYWCHASDERSGILRKRIVHKELGIISRTKCCWNSQKADILFSVQRLQCPGVRPKARTWETVNTLHCRLSNNRNYFSHHMFPPISSVFTEQLRTFVKNLKPIKIDRGNLMY